MRVNVETEQSAFDRASKMLEGIPGGVEQAMMRAQNRALQEGRTAGTREVTKTYSVKAKDVRSTFAMHRASKSDLNAELVSRGKRLPLSIFAHTPRQDTTGANRKQVRVGVLQGGLKPLGQAFIHKGMVMQRLYAHRLPVQQKFGPSIPSMLDNEQVVDKVVDTMQKAVDKRLEHETNRILNEY